LSRLSTHVCIMEMQLIFPILLGKGPITLFLSPPSY